MPRLARNAAEEAAALIRAAIIDGRLEPGQRLKETQLAEELGISRTPIREALLLLRSEGLVELAPNRGATVRAYTIAEIEDYYEMRRLLEGYASAEAAKRMSPETIEALRQGCERFAALEAGPRDLPTLKQENEWFHQTIIEAAGSERLRGILRGLTEPLLIYNAYFWTTPHAKLAVERYHEDIVRALSERDSEAAERAMRAHIDAARQFIVSTLSNTERRLSEGVDATS